MSTLSDSLRLARTLRCTACGQPVIGCFTKHVACMTDDEAKVAREMLRSRAPAPGHSAAETSAPRQPWMTDEQARRYGDGT